MSNRTMLPGVALCSPFEQGDLDNLCGLYAGVNAVCVTSAPIRPLSPSEAQHVLHAGVAFLQRRGWLSDALIDGMPLLRQRAVTQHMGKVASQMIGISVTAAPILPARSKVQVHAALYLVASRLAAGSAVIACFENTLWHYTVIAGMSASRLYLFDSAGLHWIERRSMGICGKGAQARHCVSLASLIEVRTELARS
jgi:hypothetical protein